MNVAVTPDGDSPDALLVHWRAAAVHPYGILLRTPNPRRLTAALYSARARACDPALARVTLRASPLRPADEVWLEPPADAG